ncbi:MAG: DUF559 domain-containing protein [Lentisphaerota bacterium]
MKTSSLAKELRRDQTWAEKTLWKHLHNRKAGDFKFRRQHILGPYILDFFCVEAAYAVELDGGGHGYPDHRKRDADRDAYLRTHGVQIKRVWNSQLRRNLEGVLTAIRNDLEERMSRGKPSPRPSPCKQGEGEKVAQVAVTRA